MDTERAGLLAPKKKKKVSDKRLSVTHLSVTLSFCYTYHVYKHAIELMDAVGGAIGGGGWSY